MPPTAVTAPVSMPFSPSTASRHGQASSASPWNMWKPYIDSTIEHVPDGAAKIAFDKFHVAQHLGDAVDRVRRGEHKQLRASGDDRLKGSRYLWLQNPAEISADRWAEFAPLRSSSLKTSRAWALKEFAMQLWGYRQRGWAHRAWMRWYSWAIRSRLEPVKKVARMIRTHLDGILTAIVKGVTNARAEGINATIQWLKYTARGYRSRDRFRTAIYFHLGGLDLYPAGFMSAPHTRT